MEVTVVDDSAPQGMRPATTAWATLLLGLLLSGGCGTTTPPARNGDGAGPALTVMTFNIRYGTANDGANHWDRRKDLCLERIHHADADVIGVQESLASQNAFLREHLPGHIALGVGRDDGREAGEFSTLLVRRERFTLIDSGTFWLSETPEVAGSRSWDSSLPRIATWARVHDRQAGGRPLLLINTHFDHRGVVARMQAARSIRHFIATRAADAAVIVTGDFNAAPGSEPHRTLLDPGNDGVVLIDAHQAIHGQGEKPEDGTAHAFKGVPTTRRIDWVLHTPAFVTREVLIDRHRQGALFPSDHYPVIAHLAWR
jgi:endonuclease/exonuclease/phosphatase family metal-dependent hydrolase